jgi:carboxymethylenebutenolidase
MTNDWAIVVLPEIFGINGFVQGVVDRLSKTHGVPVVALDFALPVTGESRIFAYADMEEAHAVAKQVTQAGFVAQLSAQIDAIQTEHPSVTKIVIVGFCFGGSLAYLAGTDMRVKTVVSYYGARAHDNVATLVRERCGSDLKVLSLYGGTDATITPEDRAATKSLFDVAHISYVEKVYPDAGHAFMNQERADRYHTSAASDSIPLVDSFLRN